MALKRCREKCSKLSLPFESRESAASYVAPTPPSVFRASPLTPSEIANNLRDELKRLRRRRQVVDEAQMRRTPSPTLMGSPTGPLSPASGMQPVDAGPACLRIHSKTPFLPDCMMDSTAGTAEGPRRGQDKPVFTLKQMTIICERMCRVSIKLNLRHADGC